MSSTRQMCTFVLDGMTFGIDVTCVQEVLRVQTTTPVPLASRAVSGLINLRGQIVTAIDLRAVLGLGPSPTPPMNVVICRASGPTSLLVDAIGDVLELDESTFERPPNTLSAATRTLIRGAYKLDHGFVLAIDVDAALATVFPRSQTIH